MASADPTGYLALDLDTLTQGYLIPPFTASPSQTTGSGLTTLTFVGTAIGIGVGMPVAGKNIAPDTTVAKVDTVTTVTTQQGSQRGRRDDGNRDYVQLRKLSHHGDSQCEYCRTGTTLTFSGASSSEGIAARMTVSGTNIPSGTTVLTSVTTTTVTLSAAVTGNVQTSDVLTFNYTTNPISTNTSVDCPSGKVLTFASTAGSSPT